MISFFGKKAAKPPKKPKLLEWRAQTGNAATPPRQLQGTASSSEVILVAIDAGIKPISKHAVEWALINVAQEGDCLTLLAIINPALTSSGWKFWVSIGRHCTNTSSKRSSSKNVGASGGPEVDESQISRNCNDMLQQFQRRCEAKKVKVRVHVLAATMKGTVAAQAAKLHASWVVLDRHLKKEEKYCLEQLQCSLAVVGSGGASQATKILRLNLKTRPEGTGLHGGTVDDDDDHKQPPPEAEEDSSSVLLDGLSFSNIPMGFPTSSAASSDHNLKSSTSTDRDQSASPSSSSTFTSDYTSTSPTSSLVAGNGTVSDYQPAATQAPITSAATIKKKFEFSGLAALSQQTSPATTGRSSPEGDLIKGPSKIGRFHKEEQMQGRSQRSTNGSGISSPATSYINPTATLSAPVSRCSSDSRSSFDPFDQNYDNLDESAVALKASVLSLSQSEWNTHANPNLIAGSVHYPSSESNSNSPRMLSHLLNSPMSKSEELQSTQNKPPDRNPWKGGGRFHKKNSSNMQDLGMGDMNGQNQVPQDDAAKGDFESIIDESDSRIRKALSGGVSSSGAPPLCSICQHQAPAFGKPAIRFSYAELQKATNNFSKDNFLAEGGFGSVYKGMLSGGQKVAVKQHRKASAQGDKEFCSEVEVLACAQHRNVVLLMGYCIERGRRMLVYEYVCNGSLDKHLFNRENPPMEWRWRQKVAVGAARGLRFLHEDCRVGCIVHRDLRPNNILLTHDFEPLVGDFGLARCQADGEHEEETRVLGTFGYLAPEYAQTGQLTEKADVYSFGVILLELITARKAIDYTRPKGQQCLTEWARPLMDDHAAYELIDSRLENRYAEYEAYCMLHAAALCIRRDPHSRPRMSQVLKILEGDLMGGSPPPTLAGGYSSIAMSTGGSSKSPAELSATDSVSRVTGGSSSQRHALVQLPGLNVSRPLLLSSRPSSTASSPRGATSVASRSPRTSPRAQQFLASLQNRHVTHYSTYHSRHSSRATLSPDEDSILSATAPGNVSRRSNPSDSTLRHNNDTNYL